MTGMRCAPQAALAGVPMAAAGNSAQCHTMPSASSVMSASQLASRSLRRAAAHRGTRHRPNSARAFVARMELSRTLGYLAITGARMRAARDAIVAGRGRIVAQSGRRAALSRRAHSL